jgi:hypothetical protein
MLAMACAELGQFDEAVRWTQEGARLAPDERRGAAENLLQLFKARKPYRMRDAPSGQN